MPASGHISRSRWVSLTIRRPRLTTRSSTSGAFPAGANLVERVQHCPAACEPDPLAEERLEFGMRQALLASCRERARDLRTHVPVLVELPARVEPISRRRRAGREELPVPTPDVERDRVDAEPRREPRRSQSDHPRLPFQD